LLTKTALCGQLLGSARKSSSAADDASNSPFKQIIIAIGAGAKVSLSAFEHLLRL